MMFGSILLLPCLVVLAPTTWYVAADGDDAAEGRAPETAWRSLERVSAAELAPGDQVLFRRGDLWRGTLRPRSGAPGAPVSYGAFGTGEKPRLQCSVAMDEPADWRAEGDGIWSAGDAPEPPDELPATTAEERVGGFSLHAENGAQVAIEGNPATGWQLRCTASGTANNHIQLSAVNIPVSAGSVYRAAVRLTSTAPFVIEAPQLMKAGSPWTGYSSTPLRTRQVGPEGVDLVQYYRVGMTDPQARLTFFLGGLIPAGATLTLDELSFARVPAEEAPNDALTLGVDVGNLIFDGGPTTGWKVFAREQLTEDLRFWYDRLSKRVYLRSDQNPAERFASIELALRRHIIDESGAGWVTYEDLDLRYGAAHGIGGGDTHNIVARGLDISYIGGGDQTGPPRHVRFGNGIEFWGNAHDNLVERCRIWQIYDAALTNQSSGGRVEHINLVYRDNEIWDSEYSFEYWNRPEESVTRNVRFENNVCRDAGGGWAHAQRPDPGGRHLCFYATDAPHEALVVTGNWFIGCTDNSLYAPQLRAEQVRTLDLRANTWWQPEGDWAWVVGERYPQARFAEYQAKYGNADQAVFSDRLPDAPRD